MHLSDHDLRQMDEDWIKRLAPDKLRYALQHALNDLRQARDRLKTTPHNSSRPPGSMAPWDRSSAITAQDVDVSDDPPDPPDPPAAADTATPEAKEPSGAGDKPDTSSRKQAVRRPCGKQPGAPGHGRIQVLPVDDHCAHRPIICSGCDAPLLDATPMQAWCGWDQVDIAPLPEGQAGLRLCCNRHTLFEARCPCGHCTRAMPYRAPDDGLWEHIEVNQWRLVGPHLAAMIVVLALRMRLSRVRIREFLGEFLGLALATGTIDQTIREAGRASAPLEDELVADIEQAALLYVDETPWQESATLLWLWTLVCATSVLFVVGQRSRDMLVNILGNKFVGVLMSDGYTVYRHWQNRLRCWAHLKRKMVGLSESTDARVARVGEGMRMQFAILMAAIYAARLEPPPDGLAEALATPMATLKAMCLQHRDDTHEKLHALAVEMLLDWDVIMRQVKEPLLPLTNNDAERSLRHWVILRRISHGTRSAGGTRAFALLASVIETCRLRKISPWRYLARVIDAARSGFSLPSLPEFTPAGDGV